MHSLVIYMQCAHTHSHILTQLLFFLVVHYVFAPTHMLVGTRNVDVVEKRAHVSVIGVRE